MRSRVEKTSFRRIIGAMLGAGGGAACIAAYRACCPVKSAPTRVSENAP
jgi:hypothetical protein